MTDYEGGGRYEGNGSDFDQNFRAGGGSSPQPLTNSHSHGAADDFSDSKPQGAPFDVRRPSDYHSSVAATPGPSQPNPNLNLAAVGLSPSSAGGLEGPDCIFVGGLPYYLTEAQVRELLESFGPLRGFDLVKDRETGKSKGYAFCVYQNLSVTDIVCAALNGIKMGDKTLSVRRANQGANQVKPEQESVRLHAQQQIALQGAPVKIGSPSDYNPSLATTLGPSQPNPNLNLAAVGPDSIFVGGLPYYFTEAQVKELLESFGPLRGFDLVKDRETGKSKGYAFCVYQDLSVTDIACAALNGIKMGDKTLAVRRANQGANQVKPEQESVLLLAQQQIALQRLTLQPVPTKVVCLTQVVNPSELEDDNEYEDIVEDMRTEGEKFGSLANVVIPRPKGDGVSSPGVGKVFLEYADIEGATRAQAGMNGRKFAGNYVVAIFFPENKFYQGEYEG